MPVLINNDTHLAETLPQAVADSALNEGTHSIPMNDPEGNPVLAPLKDASGMLQEGYSQPSAEQLNSLSKFAKHSSTSSQVKTFIEGAAKEATLGLSTGIETALGVDPEDIRGRREANPMTHAAGQVAGLTGSLLTGVGEGKILQEAGKMAVKALPSKLKIGIPNFSRRLWSATPMERMAVKVAESGVRGGTEAALVQAGDEVSKAFSDAPGQTFETALIDIGLSGLLGGSFGGAVKGLGALGTEATQVHRLTSTLSQAKALWDKLPSGVKYVAEGAIGLNGLTKMALRQVGRLIKDDASEGARLSLSKFLGQEGVANGPAYEAMHSLAKASYRGTRKLDKATSALFQAGRDVLPGTVVDQVERNNLDNAEKLVGVELDPSWAADVGGDLGHYLPDHAMAAGVFTSNAVNYLNSIKPQPAKGAMLDMQPKADKPAMAAYKRAMSIAQSPLIVLESVKTGNVTPTDLKTISTLYPNLYQSMRMKVADKMTTHLSKKGEIPYKTRLGLSMFLGMPLDSSTMPQNIMGNQGAFNSTNRQPQGPISQPKGNSGGLKALSKMSNQYSTDSQAREIQKASNR